MPFPDGSGLDVDPFTEVQQANAQMLAETGNGLGVVGAGSPTAGVGWPDGLGPTQPEAFQEGMPAYLTNPSQFVVNPNDRDPNEPGGGFQLADPRTAATRPDLHLATASVGHAPGHTEGAPDDGTAIASLPDDLREGTTSINCGGCAFYSENSCTKYGGWPVDATQVCDDFTVRTMAASQEHQAAIWMPGAQLDLGVDDNGRFWKVACKTGTLALSPGPGQIDLDQPLNLTDELFDDIKLAFDEKAFPYVTVPETHANGSLENHGYVKALEVLDKAALLADARIDPESKVAIENDSESTRYLLTGIDFTEPETKGKAERGSIADTSVGVKFGFRNKRSGKTYRAALEHLAMTSVPWVDGLIPFGAAALGQQPFDADEAMVPYDGVFVQLSSEQLAKMREPATEHRRRDRTQQANLLKLGMRVSITNDRWDDISVNLDQATRALSELSDGDKLELPMGVCVQRASDDGIPLYLINEGYSGKVTVKHDINAAVLMAANSMAVLKAREDAERLQRAEKPISVAYSQPTRSNQDHPTLPASRETGTIPVELHASPSHGDQHTMTMTVEELLASQQAAQEAADQRIAELTSQLQLAQGTLTHQGSTLHLSDVEKKVRKLSDAGLPPAVLLAARQVYTADKPWEREQDGLSLSVQVAKTGGDGKVTTEGHDLTSPTEIVDFILSAIPTAGADEATRLASVHMNLAAQSEAQQDKATDAKSQVEQHEREKHPERFKDNGKGERV